MKFLIVACLTLLAAAHGFPAVSQWSLNELSEAIQNPSTDPQLLPYLENALNELMTDLWTGGSQTVATVVLPAAVVEAVTPVEVAPVAVAEESPKSSPLVQIILNINSNQATSPVAPAAAEDVIVPVAPVDVAVVPEAVGVAVLPETVGVAVLPETVGVAVLPETVGVAVLPETVGVAVLPETVGVAVLPESVAVAAVPETVAVAGAANPIDTIAVEAAEINPIDVISPVSVVPGIAAGGILV